MENNNKNRVREFVELISQSGLSPLDKEWFLMKFFEDNGLTEEVEKKLLEALEESSDALRVAQIMENEEVRKAMTKTLKESGLQEKMENFMKLKLELEANLRKRDELTKKHQAASDKMWNDLLAKHGDDPDSEELATEFNAWIEEYKNTNEAEYQRLVDAVKQGREAVDQAEEAMLALAEEVRKKQQEG